MCWMCVRIHLKNDFHVLPFFCLVFFCVFFLRQLFKLVSLDDFHDLMIIFDDCVLHILIFIALDVIVKKNGFSRRNSHYFENNFFFTNVLIFWVCFHFLNCFICLERFFIRFCSVFTVVRFVCYICVIVWLCMYELWVYLRLCNLCKIMCFFSSLHTNTKNPKYIVYMLSFC